MKQRLKSSTTNAGAMFNRRTCLATSAALLMKPMVSCADFEFPKHFVGANTAVNGYGLFAAIDLLRDLGFRTIEIQNLMGAPEPTVGKFPGFRWEHTDDEMRDRIKNALKDFELITTHLPYQGLEYFGPAGEQARNSCRDDGEVTGGNCFSGSKNRSGTPKAGAGNEPR